MDPAQIVEEMLEANRIEYADRLGPCLETPLVDPTQLPLQVDIYSFRPDQEIYVVRDDMLCGGTKSRVAYQFLRDHADYPEYVYISPWYGGAQIALPWLLRLLDQEQPLASGPRKATIIMDRYPFGVYFPEWTLPPLGQLGQLYGAQFIQLDPGQDKLAFALQYARDKGALYIKPGFDYPEVIQEIARYGQQLQDRYGRFNEAWVATGSGTMIRGLQAGDVADDYYAVCIFQPCPDVGRAHSIQHPQGHNDHLPLDQRAPYRSTLRYDQKTWPYVRDRPGKLLVWNVM